MAEPSTTATATAGVATADITPGAGVPMGGYGARVGVAEGLNDPLLARVVVLTDAAGTTLVIAVCDLVGVSYGLVGRARELIERELGVPASNVLVAATHTHSGPASVTARQSAEYVAMTARAIAGAARVAMRGRRPVRLKVGEVDVTTISQNRRHPDGPIEPTVRVLVADPVDDPGGPVVATLVNYACHSTVFEHDNLLWSADFPGAMARAVESSVGGVAVYVQGAAGDINPVWMRHDAAEVERVGRLLGSAVSRVVHELRPVDGDQWCANLSWSEDVPVVAAAHGRLVEDVRFAAATTTMTRPVRELPDAEVIEGELADLAAAIRAAAAAGDVDERRRITARHNELRVQAQIVRAGPLAGSLGRTTERLELQAFRLGDGAAVATLPGEFFVAIGHELRARSGLPSLFVAGYANGMVGYVPTADAFPLGGYEVGMARLPPDTAALVVDESLRLLASL